jgi:hypothetical protein
MGDKKYSLLDYANFVVALGLGVLAIVVTVMVSRSADKLGRSSLYVTIATFVFDDSPKRQHAGALMLDWAQRSYSDTPDWIAGYLRENAAQANVAVSGRPLTAPSASISEPNASADPVAASATPAETTKADNLFDAVGGVLPRLFIQVADDQQRTEAGNLRCVLNHSSVNDKPIVVPVIQKVRASPANAELRFVNKADAQEAGKIGTLVQGIIGSPIAIRDLSGKFVGREDIKPHTYELWFPEHFKIEVAGGDKCAGTSSP